MSSRFTTRRALIAAALAVLTIVVAVVGFGVWIINTQSGTRWALRTAGNVLDGALQVPEVEGTLAGPLTLGNLRYRDPAGSLDVAVQRVVLDVEVSELLRKTLHVRDLDVRGVAVALGPPKKKAPEPSQPFSLRPPLDIKVDAMHVADAAVHRAEQTLITIDAASAAGAWTGQGVNLSQLDVRSAQGEVHLQATVSGDETYVGAADGRFRWQVGERTYAGALRAQAREKVATLNARLTSPLPAHLQVDLQQQKSAPWVLTLEVPQFDPSDELLPDSSLRSLALSLRGFGDLAQATLEGSVVANEERVRLERVHVVQREREIALDALVHPEEGTVRASGTVQLADTPASAKLDLQWLDVVVPESLAGQVLHTKGELHFSGSAQSYAATGALQLGPPERLADIRLDVKGSPQRVQLDRFDIVQRAGELHATGQVDLQPTIAWRSQARARRFNPGEIAAAWPGSLNFELTSEGRIVDGKPRAGVQIANLNGELRNRPLQGRADLTIAPNMVLAGTLDVRSGRSRVRVQGEQGDAMNAHANIEVPALDDWLPGAGGELQGRITATGRWPALRIEGRVRGNSLRMATTSVDALALNFDVVEPTNPRGEINLDASRLAAGGLVFDSLRTQAAGDSQKHTLRLDATGQPLATRLQLRGSRTPKAEALGWSGTVEQLVLDVRDVARLQLQQPVDISFLERAVRVSRACFADRDIRLCLGGNSEPGGAMQAQYSLQRVPLALVAGLAPSMPVSISGVIDGEGDLSRDAQGRFGGSATVRSTHGEIARRSEPGAEGQELLLKYDDLRIAARLDGSEGSGSINARLNDTGRLQGDLALSNLSEASTALRGKLSANLPSIAVVELFAPQLANVDGQVQLRAGVAGSVDTPQLDGQLDLANLVTDIPALGLKLREGRVRVSAKPDGQFALDGSVASGKGTLRFDGSASMTGDARITAQGQQFLAADIPGANVIIDPKLELTRNAGKMSLEGEVLIPSAKVDLQKLPRAQSAQKSSPDVVVVDARTQEEAQGEALPLEAAVRVVLGKDVTLAGFGLDAKLDGQLLVRESPGTPTTGAGEVRVSGTYKAYGQDLKIRQGQLLYAGTPLDNPRLSIVAVREVEPVVAGLRIEGSARNPQLTVFSEPPMAQSNALAYLVTGKPLSEVGAGEGDAVQSAARSLGTAAGGLLAKNIGRRLGVDEVGVKDSEAIGGAALTVGQYLSPRLYLSYGVGLFEPGEVVTLRYKLSSKASLEVLNGPRDSRAGIEYRVER